MTKMFGKKPAVRDYDTPQFRHYAAALGLAAPPTKTANLSRMLMDLGASTNDIAALFPMDGNDAYGDCTIAAAAHAITAWKAWLRQRVIAPQAQVEQTYFTLTGGPDSGLDELSVLKYWRKTGIGGDKIIAYASLRPFNLVHIKQAIATFGGLYIGFQCQQAVETEFDAGQPWTPGPLTGDGHAVYVYDYDDTGISCFTWGATQRGTWAWWQECVDEAYVILPPEAATPGFIPGVNFATLIKDMPLVTG